ncbi:reverse transcriptase domain-containing protein [Tanacetum coccineum]|uniref:Reverse transcriptase domain-containing protein n=1 Tax=Tanacetum coccineum TaxID=301880 RepID=A0ABQ4XU11_9ASTR
MVPTIASLTGYSGETIWPLGQLRLLVTMGDVEHFTKAWMNFMIVRSLSQYNGIIRRPEIGEIQAVPSTAHEMLKFPVDEGIVIIRSTILIPAKCAIVATSSKEIHKEAEVCHENLKVALHLNFPDQEVAIGGTLSTKGRTELYSLLKENFDIFALQSSDMTAVEGMFLGYRITPEGIKPCPDKTEVVLRLPSPRTIKEVQSLNGKLASLNRFLSKSAKKSLPLFKTLKKCIKKSDFHWTPEAEHAFKQLKQHLSELPMLVAPKPKEELIVYLSASHGAIIAALMTERDKVQMPIYFVSRALQGPELNYTPMKKLVLALVFAAKSRATTKMERYAGRTQYHVPAKDIRERIVDIVYGRIIMCGWIGCGPNTDLPEGNRVYLRAKMGMRNVHVSVDSKLVANQVLGTYIAKEENMIKYLEKAKSLISSFANFSISQVPRSKNKKVDALSKIASTSFAHLSKQVLVEILKEKSIQEEEVATVVEEEGPTWMTPIVEYLKNGTLPDDRNEVSKLCIKARQYELLEGVLYRWSFLKPWLRCVRPLQADYVIQKIHEGSCSMHARPQSVVAKAIQLGYYWPTMHRDARYMIQKCNDCQIHRPWIEAKAVATITGSQVKKFVWDNIVCRFGLLGEIVSKNEAIIPAEIGIPTYRTTIVDAVHNDEELRLNLDLLEERRERAAIREAKAKLKMTKGKLGPKWEGPYEVTEALGDGAYKLRSTDGTVLLRTWNIANLKKVLPLSYGSCMDEFALQL